MDSGSMGEDQQVQRTYAGLRSWCLFLAGLSLLDLLITLVLVIIHAANPASIAVTDLTPFVYILTGGSAASTASGVLWLLLRYPKQRKVILVLLCITVGIMVAHLYTINSPATSQCFGTVGVQGCVFDEIRYIPAAQALLSGEKCGPYLDNCNLEHPFLAKAFIAAGIALFGDNDFGWRFFEALLGTLCIPLVFGICVKFTRDNRLALFAAFLIAFETLFFVQSSIAVIDIYMIFFGLLAFLVYVADVHFWKFDRYVISGMLLGLSALSKELGVFMLAFLVFYILVFGAGGRRVRTISSVKMLAVAVALFCVGLQLYDSLFGNSVTTTFVADIQYILSYSASLKVNGFSIFANGQPPYITPFEWFLYYFPVNYDVIHATATTGLRSISYVSVGYFGVPNFIETWFVYIWVPYVVYLGYKRWKGRRDAAHGSPSHKLPGTLWSPGSFAYSSAGSTSTTSSTGPTKPMTYGYQSVQGGEAPAYELARFAALWFAFTFVPYVLIFLYGRVTYPYYILAADPALAIGMAYVMTRRWFPRGIAYILLAAVFGWFFLFYPDKSFLPIWIRALLGY
ncbi:MAG: glycosyltransferase family 39 protein [Thaumarchaeota archaeon]|nr:glycosyltransferase family 39 protein [Nitrososphaerota archaeon]